MLKRLFILLMVCLLTQTTFAQLKALPIASQTNEILTVDEYLELLSASTTSRGLTVNPELTKVKSLLDDVKSSIYLTNNNVNVYGTNPECIYADVNSLGLITRSNLNTNSVEMVRLTINNARELNTVVDFNYLSNLPSIKFIYVLVAFDCTESQVLQYIGTNYNPNCKIVYKIDKGA